MPTQRTHSITLGTILYYLGLCALSVLVIGYVLFQARNFIQGPVISLADTGSVLHHEHRIGISGNAHNIVSLTLNGKEIHTNASGDFTHTLVLPRGYTIVTLEAQDRFGRTTTLTREFVYAPQS